MELVAILRALWRRRLLFGIGFAVIAAITVMLAANTATRTGKATTRVMLDTQNSQLVGASPSGAETLTWRAQLLAELLASDPLHDRLAAEAGIKADQLRVVEPLLLTPEVETAIPRHSVEGAALSPEPYVVRVEFNDQVPVVAVEATAPDRASAVRLAKATTSVMQSEDVPAPVRGLQSFEVEPARAIKSEDVISRPPPVKALAFGLVLLGLWSAVLAGLPAGFLARRRRVAAAS